MMKSRNLVCCLLMLTCQFGFSAGKTDTFTDLRLRKSDGISGRYSFRQNGDGILKAYNAAGTETSSWNAETGTFNGTVSGGLTLSADDITAGTLGSDIVVQDASLSSNIPRIGATLNNFIGSMEVGGTLTVGATAQFDEDLTVDGAAHFEGGLTGIGGADIAYQNDLSAYAPLAGATFTGTVTAPTFSGSGASLTALPAASITGTLGTTHGGTGLSALGSANQILGVDSAGTALEWKTPASGSLSGLSDVDLTVGPTNGQVLTYNTASSKWKAATITAGDATLAGAQTFTGVKTFSAAVNLNGGGALAGTFTGNPTFSGNPVFSSGNVTVKRSSASTSAFTGMYLKLGQAEFALNSYRLIGFGFTNGSSDVPPAYVGYQEISSTGNTKGDLVFGTRDSVGFTDVPTTRFRIAANGTATFSNAVNLNAGGTLSGTFSGSPTFSGTVTYSGASVLTGGASIGGGTSVSKIISGTYNVSINGGASIAAGQQGNGDVTVVGAAIGDSVTVTPNFAADDADGFVFTAAVAATDTVRVYAVNASSSANAVYANPISVRITVIKF